MSRNVAIGAVGVFVVALVVLGVMLFTQSLSADNTQSASGEAIKIVTTTTQVTDLLKVLTEGGDQFQIEGLMGPGVDPHLFIASAGDVSRLSEADAIFYNGLDLEGKMGEVFAQMSGRGIPTIAVAQGVDPDRLIHNESFADNLDPHIWFDIDIWRQVTVYVRDWLIQFYPERQALFERNAQQYLSELAGLEEALVVQVSQLPQAKRVLVTSHDAFEYFGRAFGFEVYGIQGSSTATEAGVADIQNLADFIVERELGAIFTESSVSAQTIDALREAVQDRGFNVVVGGEIYSDAMGAAGTEEGTYLGMMRANVNVIVNRLLEQP